MRYLAAVVVAVLLTISVQVALEEPQSAEAAAWCYAGIWPWTAETGYSACRYGTPWYVTHRVNVLCQTATGQYWVYGRRAYFMETSLARCGFGGWARLITVTQWGA